MSYAAHYARRFTLVELLVVLFILAAVAAMTSTVVSQADDQLRFEVTQERLRSIREAIVGRPGRRGIDGFVADVGRLPHNLAELVQPGAIPSYRVADGTAPVTSSNGIRFGWRGPYVAALSELGGGAAYWDGWGNPDRGLSNFGWNVPLHDPLGHFEVQSFGRDGRAGAQPADDLYAQDYPPLGDSLIVQDDICVHLEGRSIGVTVRNTSAAGFPSTSIELLVAYPAGSGGFLCHRSDPELVTVPANASTLVTFTFVPSGGGTLVVPQGERSFELVLAGTATPVGLSSPQLVELWPRGPMVSTLPEPWDVQ
ncbi:MAG: hypothetical protein KDD82_14685 [Planctomycetes bacterium]|nr:hypothetical protein [Planctomycetota bacterium]